MRRLFRPVLILLALVFLFEAWLWERLAPGVAWIVARIPLHALKLRLAAAIERLPPIATLVVFVVPVLLLLPIKFLGLWMLTRGHWLGALGVLALAKVVSLGVTAFIFDLTRPKLLQLAWFSRLYGRVMAWLGWAHELIDPIKRRIQRLPSHAGAAARGTCAAAARACPPAHAIDPGGVGVNAPDRAFGGVGVSDPEQALSLFAARNSGH